MLKNRPPYDAEVDAEVAKEYQRQHEEKRKACPDHGREIEAVRTRMADLEGSITRLGENVVASQQRREEMMRMILRNQGQKQLNAGEDMIEPSSSAKMLGTSALTSMTVELTTLVPQPVPTPALTVVGTADTRLAAVVQVPSEVAVDAAMDVTLNKQGVDTSPGTVTTSVVEDIQEEEENKSPESQAIGDEVEPEPKEGPLQPMEEIDKGHHDIEGNVDIPEENAILEQVTSSKTLECNPFMQFFANAKQTLSLSCRRTCCFLCHVRCRHDICVDVCLDRMEFQLERSNKPYTLSLM